MKRSLVGADLKGYVMIGDHLLSESKIESIRKKLKEEAEKEEKEEKEEERLANSESSLTLGKAARIIESLGVTFSPTLILSFLGFVIEWQGLDYDASKVKLMNNNDNSSSKKLA